MGVIRIAAIGNIRIAVEIPEFEGINLTDDAVSDLEDVLADVATERGRQMLLGFGPAHDDEHSLPELEAQIQQQLLKAAAMAPTVPGYRERLVQVAAIAVAAIESFDRRRLVTVEDAHV
jgi:hypothetical protein